MNAFIKWEFPVEEYGMESAYDFLAMPMICPAPRFHIYTTICMSQMNIHGDHICTMFILYMAYTHIKIYMHEPYCCMRRSQHVTDSAVLTCMRAKQAQIERFSRTSATWKESRNICRNICILLECFAPFSAAMNEVIDFNSTAKKGYLWPRLQGGIDYTMCLWGEINGKSHVLDETLP